MATRGSRAGTWRAGIGTLAPVDKLAVGGRTRVEAQYETVYPAPVDAVVEANECVTVPDAAASWLT